MPSSPPPPPNRSQFTDEEYAYLKAKVDRLIFLLDASAMPQQVKTAWITLLPEMNLDQIDRLNALLEKEIEVAAEYAKQQPENDELVVKLKAAKERYDSKISTADQAAMTTLQDIEKQLPQ